MYVEKWVVISVIMFLTIAGLFVRQKIVRILCWLLALPPFVIGLYAFTHGGIAEPFSTKFMIQFCSMAFLPTVGCIVGQAMIHYTPKENDD